MRRVPVDSVLDELVRVPAEAEEVDELSGFHALAPFRAR